MANPIRRSVAAAIQAQSERDAKKLDQNIHELNNSKAENVFSEGMNVAGAKRGAGTFYHGLGGFDKTLLIKPGIHKPRF